MIGRLKYRLFVMLLMGVGLPLCAMDNGNGDDAHTRLATTAKEPSDSYLPDGSGDEAEPAVRPNDSEEKTIPIGRGRVPLIGDPKQRVEFYIQLVGGTLVAVSATIGGLKFLKMQRGFAANARNSKRKMEGEPLLPENKWFFKRWWQRGMALFRRA